MGLISSATNDVESAPKKQRKVMPSQEVELLDMYHRLRSAAVLACHFKINESSIWPTVKEKEICETFAAAMLAGAKTLYFL